tara:strand:+ start:10775 stop:10981 length:207 start_codon:yes stop_codon:yes gene_type:complete
MWQDKPMVLIYETIRSLDEQVEKVHTSVADSIESAIQYLDVSADTDRMMPDVQSALEMLRDAAKELRG